MTHFEYQWFLSLPGYIKCGVRGHRGQKTLKNCSSMLCVCVRHVHTCRWPAGQPRGTHFARCSNGTLTWEWRERREAWSRSKGEDRNLKNTLCLKIELFLSSWFTSWVQFLGLICAENGYLWPVSRLVQVVRNKIRSTHKETEAHKLDQKAGHCKVILFTGAIRS